MSTVDWAKNEIEIEKNRLTDTQDDRYFSMCLDSALKAYETLCGDDHSGSSFEITKSILFRLCNDMPLSPIEDTEDVWVDVAWAFTDHKVYQCKRMSSLFKNVHADGTVTYDDNDRIICYSPDRPDLIFHSGVVSRWFDKHYPITLPYYPGRPIKVKVAEHLTDRENGDFDTIAILSAEFPDNDIESRFANIGVYYSLDEDKPKEISYEEYVERVNKEKERIANEQSQRT